MLKKKDLVYLLVITIIGSIWAFFILAKADEAYSQLVFLSESQIR